MGNEAEAQVQARKRELGAQIRAAREAARLTQTEVGRLVGDKDQAAVSAWEKGQNQPSALDLLRLQEVLGARFGEHQPDVESAVRLAQVRTRVGQMWTMASAMAELARQTEVDLATPADDAGARLDQARAAADSAAMAAAPAAPAHRRKKRRAG